MQDIFNAIANAIIDALPPGKSFKYAKLFISRFEGTVRYEGSYYDEKDKEEYIDLWKFKFNGDLIHELYKITMNAPLKHKNWNKAVFTLYSDGKFNMEYIWDQALQDEVDRLNREARS